MIRARGLAPSVGAGGTIVVAGLCALLFVSALLTFRAWPEHGGPRSEGSLSMRVPEIKAAGREAVARPAAPTVTLKAAAPRRAARTAGGAARPRSSRAATPRAAYRAPATASPAPAAAAPQQPVASQPAATRPATTAGGSNGASKPSTPAPGPLESVVSTGRDTVQQLTTPAPPLPAPVAKPVQQTLDTVQQTARTADGLVAPLVP